MKAAGAKPVAGKIHTTAKLATAKITATAKPLAKTGAKTRPLWAERQKRKNAVLLFAPFALFLALSLLLIGLRMSVGHLAKTILELEAQVTQLQDENNRYLARAEQLASYSRISRLAHERLGLIGLAPKLIVVSSE